MRVENPMCDHGKCIKADGEVRVLPLNGDSNAIVCHSCYRHHMTDRRRQNAKLSKDNQWSLPLWESLKVYPGAL